jgi:hypothetical protein
MIPAVKHRTQHQSAAPTPLRTNRVGRRNETLIGAVLSLALALTTSGCAERDLAQRGLNHVGSKLKGTPSECSFAAEIAMLDVDVGAALAGWEVLERRCWLVLESTGQVVGRFDYDWSESEGIRGHSIYNGTHLVDGSRRNPDRITTVVGVIVRPLVPFLETPSNIAQSEIIGQAIKIR